MPCTTKEGWNLFVKPSLWLTTNQFRNLIWHHLKLPFWFSHVYPNMRRAEKCFLSGMCKFQLNQQNKLRQNKVGSAGKTHLLQKTKPKQTIPKLKMGVGMDKGRWKEKWEIIRQWGYIDPQQDSNSIRQGPCRSKNHVTFASKDLLSV